MNWKANTKRIGKTTNSNIVAIIPNQNGQEGSKEKQPINCEEVKKGKVLKYIKKREYPLTWRKP